MAARPVYKKAPSPPPAPPSTWSWWLEGGAFNTGGGGVGVPTFKPNWGGEGAIGFDWQAQPSWHVLGQFRYGSASKSKPLNFTNASAGGTTVTVNGTQSLREDHWLVDFGVGRDFGLGNGNAMWTFGVRVADLRSKLTSNANFTAKTFTPSVGGMSVASVTKARSLPKKNPPSSVPARDLVFRATFRLAASGASTGLPALQCCSASVTSR
jgi:hypothetical protein